MTGILVAIWISVGISLTIRAILVRMQTPPAVVPPVETRREPEKPRKKTITDKIDEIRAEADRMKQSNVDVIDVDAWKDRRITEILYEQ